MPVNDRLRLDILSFQKIDSGCGILKNLYGSLIVIEGGLTLA